jgi:hypothetical protein
VQDEFNEKARAKAALLAAPAGLAAPIGIGIFVVGVLQTL